MVRHVREPLVSTRPGLSSVEGGETGNALEGQKKSRERTISVGGVAKRVKRTRMFDSHFSVITLS